MTEEEITREMAEIYSSWLLVLLTEHMKKGDHDEMNVVLMDLARTVGEGSLVNLAVHLKNPPDIRVTPGDGHSTLIDKEILKRKVDVALEEMELKKEDFVQ